MRFHVNIPRKKTFTNSPDPSRELESTFEINRNMEMYEHELYFIAQMFEDNWQPRDTVIDRTEGTVNNVGLKRFVGR